jgi:uncharacterized DUF497 family protein
MKIFRWNVEKNAALLQKRGITFEEVVQRLESGERYIEMDHPNQERYPNQKIIIIEIDKYAYLIPCVINGDEYFLKTIIPSRKATKKHIGGSNGK